MGVVKSDSPQIVQLLKTETIPKQPSSSSSTTPSKQVPLSQQRQKQHQNEETPLFQALGTVIATPYLKDDLLKVIINDDEYDLAYVRGRRTQAHRILKSKLEENSSKEMFLKLYPNAVFWGSPKKLKLFFSLVRFSYNCQRIDNYPKGFVLRGIWQMIPHCQSPVISIYRNLNQLPMLKRLDTKQQIYFVKPNHLPVSWDAPVEPFQFNPQGKKGSQMPRYFVEVRATFQDGLYVVEEMLREPTLNIPKSLKLPRVG